MSPEYESSRFGGLASSPLWGSSGRPRSSSISLERQTIQLCGSAPSRKRSSELRPDLDVGGAGALGDLAEPPVVIPPQRLHVAGLHERAERLLVLHLINGHVAKFVLAQDRAVAPGAHGARIAQELGAVFPVVPAVERNLLLLRDRRLDHEEYRCHEVPPILEPFHRSRSTQPSARAFGPHLELPHARQSPGRVSARPTSCRLPAGEIRAAPGARGCRPGPARRPRQAPRTPSPSR